MADEHSFNFFHGAILDEDADVFLVQDGDYLIQAKPDRRFGQPKLILAVKKGQTKVRRIDIVKIEGAGYRFMGKSYADLQQLINRFLTRPLELANGDTVLLKRPIPKGKFSFNHKDIRLQRKINTDAYGTVYKGVMVKDDHPIVVKRIDSYGKNDQAFIDMMKEAREMQLFDPNFYGLILDRAPYLLLLNNISDIQSTDTVDTVISDVRLSCIAPLPSFQPSDSGRIILNRDWRNALSPVKDRNEISSLSSGKSSSESEDDEEINVGLPPQYYNDTNDSSVNEQGPNIDYSFPFTLKCKSLLRNFKRFWEAVRKLAGDRQFIIKRLKKQLSKERAFSDDQIIHINATINLLEEMLNSYIPIVPHWKASYQNGSDKKIIIRKGFIYEQYEGTNGFRCIYKNYHDWDHCIAFIVIDNFDTIIEGSFCYHYHPGLEEYTEDVPPPNGTPISFRRVEKNRLKYGKYSKLIELLDQLLNEVIQWRRHIAICLENLKLIYEYLNDLENVDFTALSKYNTNLYKNVIAETKNLLKCVRLDKCSV